MCQGLEDYPGQDLLAADLNSRSVSLVICTTKATKIMSFLVLDRPSAHHTYSALRRWLVALKSKSCVKDKIEIILVVSSQGRTTLVLA